MKKNETDKQCAFSRREAMQIGAAAAAVGLIATVPGTSNAAPPPPASGSAAGSNTGPGHVVAVHKKGMVAGKFPDATIAREAVHTAVKTLSGKSDLGAAFGSFIKADDRVGIKINVLGGKFACTMKEVVDAVIEGVKAVGVPDANIMVFDQFGGNMRGARYAWQEKEGKLRVLNNDLLGYDETLTTTEGGGKGRLAKTLLWTTAVINVPPMKDHDLCGITCAMKNMVYGCVERPAQMHAQFATAMPHFYAHDAIRSRVKLIIADGSFCLYDGGPKNNPSANLPHETIYATTDPVAMDAICAEVVEKFRADNKMRTLAAVRRPVVHLELSEKLGLGVGKRDKIRLQTIEL